jgi:hypothetical protein
MATQIKLRRDTAANWVLEDPILAEGEPGYETDTGLLKLGDGATTWLNLSYLNNNSIQDNTVCPAGVETVIYTSTGSLKHAIKLFVMVEGPDGLNGATWETQACDIIAVKGYVDNIVSVSAYGVTYSSTATLATFDGQWNALTNRIEITCQPTSLTDSVVASVQAIELTSND